MFRKFLNVLHLKCQVRKIDAKRHRSAGWVAANFDKFIAVRRMQKDEFRATRRFVPAHFLQAEHLSVKVDRLFEIIHAIPRVEEFFDHGCVFMPQAAYGGK